MRNEAVAAGGCPTHFKPTTRLNSLGTGLEYAAPPKSRARIPWHEDRVARREAAASPFIVVRCGVCKWTRSCASVSAGGGAASAAGAGVETDIADLGQAGWAGAVSTYLSL